MQIELKKCTENELDIILSISRTTFIEAFKHQNKAEDFDSYMQQAFSTEVISRQLKTSGSTFFLIQYRLQTAGYIKLNLPGAQSDLQLYGSVELERIYISQKFQGLGLGSRVLQMVIDRAINQKASLLWLGVWKQNQGAINLYKRFGFEAFGTHPYFIGNDKQTDILMRLRLNGA